MEVEDRTCSVPRPCLLRRKLIRMGILSIKKRSQRGSRSNPIRIPRPPQHTEDTKETSLIEKSMGPLDHPSLEPELPLNLRLELINRARPVGGGLSGTGEDGIKDQVQDSSKIDLPYHLRARQGIQSNGKGRASPCSRKVLVSGTGSNWTEGRNGRSEATRLAFESKHGHLQLRGSSRSSMDEPGQFLIPAEEEGELAQPHQQPAFSTRKELKMKRRIFVHYLWSGFKGTLPNPSLRWNKTQTDDVESRRPGRESPFQMVISVLKARPTDGNSYLYCLSNPKTLIRGGVLRIGSDFIPAVKLLPDPAHLPLKQECLFL
ncbi:hypothetical protein ACFE04_019744 [Oxalis oulophora]